MHRDAWNFQVENTCITSADISLEEYIRYSEFNVIKTRNDLTLFFVSYDEKSSIRPGKELSWNLMRHS